MPPRKPKPLLHHLRSHVRDAVTGHYATRCGIDGLPYRGHEPMAEGSASAIVVGGLRVFLATSEERVTCPRCRIDLNDEQKKVLRILFDHGPARVMWTTHDFEWSAEGQVRIWTKPLYFRQLKEKGLVATNEKVGTEWLTSAGRSYAYGLPKVKQQ